ncbi:hypothetical protein PMAYCL1PPCAC_08222, partial [Pristionchus mayeri]
DDIPLEERCPFKCDKCERRFPEKSGLKRHLQVKHDDPEKAKNHPFKCDECGATFKNKKSLTFHAKVHMRNRHMGELHSFKIV